MSHSGNSGRFTEQDIEAVRRGFSNDHGRYIALMDLSHFLTTDNVEALLPAAEVVLNRPMTGPLNTSMVELASATNRTIDLEGMAPPAPPLPRMMKNLLKDRRRFHRQIVATTPPPPIPEYDVEIVTAACKSVENYQLKELFEDVSGGEALKDRDDFALDLLYESAVCRDAIGEKFLKKEMEFGP